MATRLKELSLFSGAGGGLLGTHHLLGWECIGYVEWNDYCQRVLAARIADGLIPAAPIFTDVREFVQSGAAEQYRGFADVVTAGFPCQPFSEAGERRGADDERNMWPATLDAIRAVRPRFVMLENVPGIISCGYAGTVLCGLSKLGYVGRWGIIRASETGAIHHRARWWVVAHAKGCTKLYKPKRNEHSPKRMSYYRPTWREDRSFDASASRLCRVVDGVPNRVDATSALGNAQVPIVAATAWRILANG